jgi:nitroreductase
MDLIEAIDTRSSAARLSGPGPAPQHLELILHAADRAPDHGRLKPWRLIVLEGPDRERFAAAAAEAKRRLTPALTDEQVAADREKTLRTPTLIVVGCSVREHPKVPEIEQVVATGAAVENLFLAAHALGYGVMWKTGAAAYDPDVKTALGLEAHDHIVGIIHVGTRLK